MNPEYDKLRESIDELHQQLQSLSSLDAEDRRLLVAALDDIQTALQRGEKPGDADDSILGRLSNAAQQFEDSHPNLSGAVGGLIDAIGRMGI